MTRPIISGGKMKARGTTIAAEKNFENKIKKYLESRGAWFIDKNGNVFHNGKLLKPTKNKNGYLSVELWENGNRKRVYVHRLVAEKYIPNPENKREVNHKDGNKLNNSVDNLEWVTSSENKYHAYKNGLRRSASQILTVDDVRYIRHCTTKSRKELAEQFGVSYWAICNVLQNKCFKGVF